MWNDPSKKPQTEPDTRRCSAQSKRVERSAPILLFTAALGFFLTQYERCDGNEYWDGVDENDTILYWSDDPMHDLAAL